MAEQARQVAAAHAGTERNIEAEYRTEVAELLAKMQPRLSLWRERGDNALLVAAAQGLGAMIGGLAAGVGAEGGVLLGGRRAAGGAGRPTRRAAGGNRVHPGGVADAGASRRPGGPGSSALVEPSETWAAVRVVPFNS